MMSHCLQNLWKGTNDDELLFPLDIIITIGKNAANNWEIYKSSKGSDTIFHLDKFPSPYVIINKPIDELSTPIIEFLAKLCKSKTKYKNVPNIGVLYTLVSNTTLGVKIGSFIINSNRKKNIIHV